MKFNIPKLGDSITLEKEWKFTLFQEHRNRTFMEKLGFNLPFKFDYNIKDHKAWQEWYYETFGGRILHDCSLPKQTKLIIDRIYIRKGAKDFDSITFKIREGKLKGSRFWVKLDSIENLHYI